MISIVLRTKNEEEWIGRCLQALSLQDWDSYEIVVVDNDSTDNTVKIAESFGCHLVMISDQEFSYGRALNRGIRHSRGELIAILSGHCVPLNDKWLERMAVRFAQSTVAGVYGRQEPLPDTGDFDKRDLWTTFGIERRVQVRDFMFHNANCMIRQHVWEEIPFDEHLIGVEDRDWARKVLERGYVIVYEPTASVYHHHGIHQGRDEGRAARVARIIELFHRGEAG